MKAKDYVPSFVNRRGNFYGIQFKAMVDFEPPMTYFTKDYKSKVEYFQKNETYDVTDVSRGLYIDKGAKVTRSSRSYALPLFNPVPELSGPELASKSKELKSSDDINLVDATQKS